MFKAEPIIKRELIGILRRKRTAVALVMLAVLLCAAVLFKWPAHGRVAYSGGQARAVFEVFAVFMLAAILCLTPIFPASAIVEEKRQGTLALLLNTPLTPLDVLVGKLTGVLGLTVLALLLSLPAAAACYSMGGIGLMSQLAPLYAILLLAALQYSALGLYVSTRAASTDAALRITFGAIFVLVILVLFPEMFLRGLLTGPSAAVIAWLRDVSPVPAVMQVLAKHLATRMAAPGASHRHAVEHYAILALLSSAALLGLTLSRLNPALVDRPRDSGKVTNERSTSVQAYRRIMFLWFFDPQRRSGLIGDWTNPVMIKEFRGSRFGRSHWIARLIGGCLVISLLLMLAAARGSAQWGPHMLGAAMVALQVALIILLTPTLAGGLISQERQQGGWQLLRMTPLPAWRIVTGKLLSVARTLALLLVATVPAYAMLVLIQPGQLGRVGRVLACLVLTALLALLTSAACSSLFRRTATATTASFVVLIALCGGTLLVWLGRHGTFSHAAVKDALLINPLAATLHAIAAPGFQQYRLLPGAWWAMGGGCVLAFAILCGQTWRLSRPR